MPLFFRPVAIRILPFLLLAFSLGLTIILIYTYLLVGGLNREYREETTTDEGTKRELSPEEIDQLAERYPAAATDIADRCLVLPEQQEMADRNIGWKRVELLTEDKLHLGQNDFYDYFIAARLTGFEEVSLNNCQYYRLSLAFDRDHSEFELFIPKGTVLTGEFRSVDPEFLKDYRESELQLRLQLYNEIDHKTKPYRFVEWEIERLERN